MKVLRMKSMGSSESGGVKNGGAGSIVWVRRRNGSWWPGRILGPDELSSSHVLSPRSGTPVKLLGREDASVDWYNLEKSKRVKEFRCGEFDDCIERAEASFGLPAKKREKYARREDAILHALELEKQFFERKFGKSGRANSVREYLSDSERKDLVGSSEVLENGKIGNGKLRNHELHQVERTVDISYLIEKKNVPQQIPKKKDVTKQGLKECGADLSCQMRGFSRFGLEQVPINPPMAASEDSSRLFVDGHVYGVSMAGPCFDNSSDSDSKISFGKRKRPLEGFTEETFPKRRESLRSIVKVRQNYSELHDSLHPDVHSRRLPIDVVHHSMFLSSELHFVTKQGNQMEMPISRLEMGPCRSQRNGVAADTSSGSSEETESDSSETHSLEAHVESGAMLSDAETCIRAQPRMHERLQVQVKHGNASSEESDDFPLDNSSQFYFHDQSPAAGVSKWHLKGKRNVRSINNKRRLIDRFTQGAHPETMDRSMGQEGPSHWLSYYHENGYTNDAGFMEDDFDRHSQGGFSKRGYLPSLSKARQNFIGHNIMELEELTLGRPLRGFCEERGVYFNTLCGSSRNGHDLLLDVDLKVQANRQGGEHVPWVSMMSRLNGKAIIGHPIQIETIEDGSTDFVVLTSDVCGTIRYDIDRSKGSPVWRTAKRSANVRATSSQLNLDGDGDDDDEYVHQSRKVRSEKSLFSNSVRRGRPPKKTHSPHLVSKMPSQANLSSSQKTKTLSSIGSDHKFPIKRKEEETSSHINGVMKSFNSGPPTVACIPVKRIFSRLQEAVCRPPSAPVKQGVQ